jgi:hypothetical protein
MRFVLLASVLLLTAGATILATPAASACPDPDGNPCDPMPLCTGGAVACVKQVVGCLERGYC